MRETRTGFGAKVNKNDFKPGQHNAEGGLQPDDDDEDDDEEVDDDGEEGEDGEEGVDVDEDEDDGSDHNFWNDNSLRFILKINEIEFLNIFKSININN